MHKSNNRYFYHIFVSPRDAPGEITLNVVWMEREFDALSRCMYPSNYNSFWDRVRYLWKKIVILSYPLHYTPPLGGFPSEYWHPLWDGKTRMVSLPDGENILKICLFVLTWSTNVTDGQTDGRTDGRTLHDSFYYSNCKHTICTVNTIQCFLSSLLIRITVAYSSNGNRKELTCYLLLPDKMYFQTIKEMPSNLNTNWLQRYLAGKE